MNHICRCTTNRQRTTYVCRWRLLSTYYAMWYSIEDINVSNCRMCCSKTSFLSRSARSITCIFAISRACSAQSWDVPSDGPPCERALYEKHVPRIGVTFGPTWRTLPAYSGLPTACSYTSFGAQRTMSTETLCVAAGSLDKSYVILSYTSST
jgi:hypothetical protein